MPEIVINVRAIPAPKAFAAAAKQFPEVLAESTHRRLFDSINLARMTLESKVPVGATGETRSGIAGTQHVTMPGPQEFFSGQVAQAIVGYPAGGHGWYVEFGRGPGRYPPEEPIVHWIQQTSRGQAFLSEIVANYPSFPLQFASHTHYAAFLLRRAHARRGTRFLPPHPPPRSLEEAYKEVEPRVIEMFNSLPAEVVMKAAELLRQA